MVLRVVYTVIKKILDETVVDPSEPSDFPMVTCHRMASLTIAVRLHKDTA